MIRTSALAALAGYLVATANASPEPAPEPILGLNVPIVDNLLKGLGLNGCGIGSFLSQSSGSCESMPSCALKANVVTSASAPGSSTLLNLFSGNCISLKDCLAVSSNTFATVPGVTNLAVPIQIGVCKKKTCGTNYILNTDTGNCDYCDPSSNTIVNGICKACDLTSNTIVNGVCKACDLTSNTIVNGVCKPKQQCTIGGQVLNAAGVCVCLDGTTLIPSLNKCVSNPNCGTNEIVKVDVNTKSLTCACKDGTGVNSDGICVSLNLLGTDINAGVNLNNVLNLKRDCPEGSVLNALGVCVDLSDIHATIGTQLASLLGLVADVNTKMSKREEKRDCPEGSVLNLQNACIDLSDIHATIGTELAGLLGLVADVKTRDLQKRAACPSGSVPNAAGKCIKLSDVNSSVGVQLANLLGIYTGGYTDDGTSHVGVGTQLGGLLAAAADISTGSDKQKRTCPAGTVLSSLGLCLDLSRLNIGLGTQVSNLLGVVGNVNTQNDGANVAAGTQVGSLLGAVANVNTRMAKRDEEKRDCPDGSILNLLGVCVDLGDIHAAVGADLANLLGLSIAVNTGDGVQKRDCPDGTTLNALGLCVDISDIQAAIGTNVAGLLGVVVDANTKTKMKRDCPPGSVLTGLGICLDLSDINASIGTNLANSLGLIANVNTKSKVKRSCSEGFKFDHGAKRCVARALPRRAIAHKLNRI